MNRSQSKCRVMGIVNVTPDSFSDGGRFNSPGEAVRRARKLIAEGADIIDIGGESTRPGATPIAWEEEWRRIEPVLRELTAGDEVGGVPVSVDTYHPETAERAADFGASIINCVYERPIAAMCRICRQRNLELVLPFRPSTACPEAREASREPWVYLDPMIGFGTTRQEDLALLRAIPELAKTGRVLVGASRKRIVKRLTGEKIPGKDLAGNLTIALWAAQNGASVVRVHDVAETVQALKVAAILREGRLE